MYRDNYDPDTLPYKPRLELFFHNQMRDASPFCRGGFSLNMITRIALYVTFQMLYIRVTSLHVTVECKDRYMKHAIEHCDVNLANICGSILSTKDGNYSETCG